MDKLTFSIVCLVINLLIVISSCVYSWKVGKEIKKGQKTLNKKREEVKKDKV